MLAKVSFEKKHSFFLQKNPLRYLIFNISNNRSFLNDFFNESIILKTYDIIMIEYCLK